MDRFLSGFSFLEIERKKNSGQDNTHNSSKEWLWMLNRWLQKRWRRPLFNEADSLVVVIINGVKLVQEFETDDPLSAVGWKTLGGDKAEVVGTVGLRNEIAAIEVESESLTRLIWFLEGNIDWWEIGAVTHFTAVNGADVSFSERHSNALLRNDAHQVVVWSFIDNKECSTCIDDGRDISNVTWSDRFSINLSWRKPDSPLLEWKFLLHWNHVRPL